MKKDHADRWERVRHIWQIIDRLRSETGCPWDRKQTPESVQTYLIEEAHEAAAAVRAGSVEEAAEELGDLLFMVFFMIHLYESQGELSLEEVCERITEKMIRRHPHVFGDVHVQTAQDVRDNWEKIKAGEKASKGAAPACVPESLPALMRAYRMSSRLSQQPDTRLNDLDDRVRHFASEAQRLSKDLAQGVSVSSETFGRLLWDMANLARLKGYRAEDCLHDYLRKTDGGPC